MYNIMSIMLLLYRNEEDEKMYCETCGSQIDDDSVFCQNCGFTVKSHPDFRVNADSLLTSLASKVRINGIIWICIAVIQILLGIFVNWILLIIGVLNLVSAIGDINYSTVILKNPVGIVKKYEPLTGPVIVLIYNLVFGGLIGVVGSIYYLVAVRSFVLTNRDIFEKYDSVAPY